MLVQLLNSRLQFLLAGNEFTRGRFRTERERLVLAFPFRLILLQEIRQILRGLADLRNCLGSRGRSCLSSLDKFFALDLLTAPPIRLGPDPVRARRVLDRSRCLFSQRHPKEIARLP
jgi:hypothetical protein